MANNCYTDMNKVCDTPRGREVTSFDSKYCPALGNPANSFNCCSPCIQEPVCYDMREGEYEFEGSATVYGVCNLTKSYLIVKVDGDCEVPWGAVWPTGRVMVDTAGSYKIKYKWDACCYAEPVFGHEATVCCP